VLGTAGLGTDANINVMLAENLAAYWFLQDATAYIVNTQTASPPHQLAT